MIDSMVDVKLVVSLFESTDSKVLSWLYTILNNINSQMPNDSSCSIIFKFWTHLSGIVAIRDISVQLLEGGMQEDEGGKNTMVHCKG